MCSPLSESLADKEVQGGAHPIYVGFKRVSSLHMANHRQKLWSGDSDLPPNQDIEIGATIIQALKLISHSVGGVECRGYGLFLLRPIFLNMGNTCEWDSIKWFRMPIAFLRRA